MPWPGNGFLNQSRNWAVESTWSSCLPLGKTVISWRYSASQGRLNAPTGIAFRGDASNFEVYVLESGHGIPSVCNDQSLWPGGEFATDNPFTPDILVFNKNGRQIRGPLGKPTPNGGGLQPE